MDADELIEWQIMFRQTPFGPAHEDLRAVPGLLLNNRWRGKGEQPLEVGAFFPSLAKPKDDDWFDTAEGQVFLGKAWCVALGGAIPNA